MKLIELLVRKDGKLNNKVLTAEYFCKHGLQALWAEFLEQTKDFDHLAVRWRAQALVSGQTECPKCYCGKKVMAADGKLSSFCSHDCASNSPYKKAQRRKVDEQAAGERRKQTMLAKHGVEFNSQRAEVKAIIRASQTKALEQSWARLGDKDWLLDQHHTHGKSVRQVAKELRIDYGIVLGVYQSLGAVVYRTYNQSSAHIELSEWLTSLGLIVYDDYRPGFMGKKELDVWIPSHDVAIEINGVRYHGDAEFRNIKPKPRNYHLEKTEACAVNNITLLQFTDVQWELQKNIVQSIIRAKLGLVISRVFARKCEKKRIEWKEAAAFLENNHIHGAGKPTKDCWGLYRGGELIQVLTLGKARYGHVADFEIYRLSTKLSTIVVGGLSKLLSHVTGPVMSFVDRWIGSGKGFLAAGFELEKTTSPGYFWAKGSRTINRERAQKHKLSKLLRDKFDSSKSEQENMIAAGYWRIYNSGNLVMIKQ